MTICIAALAESGKRLVLCADQMITANIPIAYQFETDDVKKIYEINETAVVLTAGNALFAYEVVQMAINTMASERPSRAAPHSIQEVAEIVRKSFQDYRRQLVVKQFIEPRGITLVDYYNLQQKLNMGVVQEIEQNLTGYNMGVELIVAGHNHDEQCHLFSITHPGILVNQDAIGYVCVGSGAPHATYHLIGSNYKKSKTLAEVKTLVEEAKKKSEVAPGVGKSTTIIELPKLHKAESNG